MPSIACRDAGLNCDWFYENPDIAKVMVEQLKHSEEVHPDIASKMRDKYKPWEIIMALLRVIKR